MHPQATASGKVFRSLWPKLSSLGLAVAKVIDFMVIINKLKKGGEAVAVGTS